MIAKYKMVPVFLYILQVCPISSKVPFNFWIRPLSRRTIELEMGNNEDYIDTVVYCDGIPWSQGDERDRVIGMTPVYRGDKNGHIITLEPVIHHGLQLV